MPKNKEQSTLQLRKIKRDQSKKLLQILLILGVLLLVVFGILVWASFRLGGFQNIFRGDSNIVNNTVNNIGNAITSTSTPTPTPTEFVIQNVITDSSQLSRDRNLNTIVFNNNQNEYSITIKVTSTVEFVNQTGKNIGLQFSDGRQLRIKTSDTSYETFFSTGTITFADQIDSSFNQITGTIIVEN